MKQMPRLFSGFVLAGYIIAAALLAMYSYTQVDLNLTLSKVSMWQEIQKAFQHVGFYQRPLSSALYVGLLVFLFVLYGSFLKAAKRKQVSAQFLWRLIFFSSGILVVAYPAAFSYDFFNYLFTAKTVLVYHLNPYTVTPLQLAPLDPWTNFMRWTHLTSAYTPLWILLSLFPYVLGLGYFVPVLFATKGMMWGFYLLSCLAIWRVMELVDPREKVFALAVFALNPLIMVETLVSGHNDIVLVAFAMLAVLAYVRRSALSAWVYLSVSIATKLMTALLVPVFILRRGRPAMLMAMLIALAAVLVRREFLPWYFVWIVPFVAINADRLKAVRAASIVSFGLLLSYAAYLYFGEYSEIMQTVKTGIIWSGVIAGAASYAFPVTSASGRSA